MRFSKIDENGKITYMASPIMYKGVLVYHCGTTPKIEKMAKDLGFFPTEETPKPTDGEYTERWEQIDGVNVRFWDAVEGETSTPIEERLTAIENDLTAINKALKGE